MGKARMTVGAVLIAASAACAGSQGPATGPSPAVGTGTLIEVRNGSTSNLRVSAMYGGGEVSLGRVSALGTSQVRLPEGAANSFRLVASPAAGRPGDRRHVSEPIQVFPGQRVSWDLRLSPGVTDVRMSTVRVVACSGERC